MNTSENYGIGHLYIQLAKEGITDFDTVATKMQLLKNKMINNGSYTYDHYSASGSDAYSKICSSHSNTQQDCIVWSVNHYLGLNRHKLVIEKTAEIIGKYGTGSGTSAMSGGRSALHKKLEDRLCKLLNKESVLLFPTGYTANLGAISGLIGKNDLVLFDEEIHASIRDGIKLRGRKKEMFKHNSIRDLEKRLIANQGKFENIFVVVEGAYSMSGDMSPIKEIVALKEKYKFYLYLDEAHTFGLYGEDGRGYAYEQGVIDKVDFLMSTFSKSTAAIGGFVAMKEKYRALLQWRANAYLFQACFSPATAATILAALDVIKNEKEIVEDLHYKNAYMRNKLKAIGFCLGDSKSPVIPIYIQDVEKLIKIGEELYNEGIFTVSVIYPVAPIDKGRVRFILNAHHTIKQIDRTVDVLAKLALKYDLVADSNLVAKY